MPAQTLAQKAKKQDKIQQYQLKEADTGSSEVQVALLTQRIEALTTHLKQHKKDFSTQSGLLKLVGQRRSLLDYLRSKSKDRYQNLIQRLSLRK